MNYVIKKYLKSYNKCYFYSSTLRKYKKFRNKYNMLYVFKSGIFNEYRKYRFLQFSEYANGKLGYAINYDTYDNELTGLCFSELPQELQTACVNLFDSRRNKVSRMRKKIDFMLKNFDCIFLTLTFNDYYLDSLDSKYRRKIVSELCRKYHLYIANIDFGSLKGREHYHAIITSDNFDLDSWGYGFAYAQRIYKGSSSMALSKYIDKFVNHALKDTATSQRAIFSKNFRNYL